MEGDQEFLVVRQLFTNWLLLLVMYVLSKFGFSVKLRAKVNDCVFEVNRDVFERLISRFSRVRIKSIRCVNGRLLVNNVEVDNISDLIYNLEIWAKVLGWRYDSSCGCWVKGNARFKRIYYPLIEVFDYGEYDFIDVRGRDVVDVSAFVGDTAIYFALRGAKSVIAIEPHPKAYEEMVENIRLNGLEEVITPVNAGLASSSGRICIEDDDVNRAGGAYYKLGECVKVVPAVTLADIREKFNIGHEAVLKMDCEGCEFDVILNDYENIKMFKELVFEYHLHMFDRLLSKLQEVLTKDYYCKTVKEHSKNLGIIYCRRMS